MNCLAASVTSVRDFIPEVDTEWLHRLWHRTMHGRWAISLCAMLHRIGDAAWLLVAERDGVQSGFCAVDSGGGGSAGLTLLLVEPAKQRYGVATELMCLVEKRLRAMKIHKLTLGAGSGDYFWPGLPYEQDNVWSFFRDRGFLEEESSGDLIQDLEGFATPDWVSARLSSSGATLCVAVPAQQSRIAAFERLHFPAWAGYFEDEMEQGRHTNIVFAEGSDGSILGTLLCRHNTPLPWITVSGERVGTLNTLGVAPLLQGQGMGLALTAGAMEQLRERGCSRCLIQWTGLTEWYGKLGAKPWAKYRMACKIL